MTTKRAPAKRAPAKKVVVEFKQKSLSVRLREAEAERDTCLWLYKELEFKIREAAIKQMLKRPDVQEKLQEKLLAQMLQSSELSSAISGAT